MFKPKFNVWLERDGGVVMSRWRMRLLVEIGRTGSITAAAQHMEVPYRRAWERIREMEEGLGLRLVETEVGGAGGGGATLTDQAQELIARFERFADGLEEEIQDRYREAFES
jgi:molybdate transport system regulatory protein